MESTAPTRWQDWNDAGGTIVWIEGPFLYVEFICSEPDVKDRLKIQAESAATRSATTSRTGCDVKDRLRRQGQAENPSRKRSHPQCDA